MATMESPQYDPRRALYEALESNDRMLVEWVCARVKMDKLMLEGLAATGKSPLDQPVLLSLIYQVGITLDEYAPNHNNPEDVKQCRLKFDQCNRQASWVLAALTGINVNDPRIAKHVIQAGFPSPPSSSLTLTSLL